MAEERSTGMVNWFNGTKGFGFITPDDKTDYLLVTNPRSDPTAFANCRKRTVEVVEYQIAVGFRKSWRRVRSLSTKSPSAISENQGR